MNRQDALDIKRGSVVSLRQDVSKELLRGLSLTPGRKYVLTGKFGNEATLQGFYVVGDDCQEERALYDFFDRI